MLKAAYLPHAVAAALLGVLAVLLSGDMSAERSEDLHSRASGPALELIDSTVDSLLAAYRVDRSREKKWTIRTKDGEPVRIERRVFVPSDLVSLKFNRDLGISVEGFGGRVIGTERTRESVVVLHVIVDSRTVHTISLELLPEKKS